MKILFSRTTQVSKWVTITVTHKGKKFDVSVMTKDGKVQGVGVHTSYITYFNEVPDKVKDSHFKKIKEHVEKYIK